MSSSLTGTIPPPVSWAQSPDLLYVIIDVECKDIEHKVTENTFNFKGINVLDESKKYDVTLNFLKSVNPEHVTLNNIGRCLEFKIDKKESGPYWPSLTTDKTKLHFLKPNFSKWKNESDEEDGGGQPQGNNFNDIMKSRSLWGDNYDDFNFEDDEDSDDNIPSLIQNEDEDDEEGGDKEKKEDKEESVETEKDK